MVPLKKLRLGTNIFLDHKFFKGVQSSTKTVCNYYCLGIIACMERSQVTVVFGRAHSCYLKKISLQYVLYIEEGRVASKSPH